MQTILGAGGAIGVPLARELKAYTDRIRLVGRNPKAVNTGDELFQGDLTSSQSVMDAVKGSDVVYLAAGLKYDIKVWRSQWPLIMSNVINACKQYNAKLVFLDNVYPYGKVEGWMTEETPYNPTSKKGEVRARIAEQLTNEYTAGNIKASILRSADFYGPKVKTGVYNILTVNKLKAGKKPYWMVNAKVKHSFTYSPDAAKAMAMIGNTEDAYNQVWHAPTDPNTLTGEEFIIKTAAQFGANPDYAIMQKWQLLLGGVFSTQIKELVEMLYQSEYEYLFDSTKFNKRFNFAPTSYDEGIRATVQAEK